jgi:hypothetical protein
MNTLFTPLIKSLGVLTILFFFLQVRYSSGPLLEAFGIAVIAENQDYTKMFPGIAARPLTALPVFVATEIAGLSWLGYAIVQIFLGLIRVLILFQLFKNNLNHFVFLLPIALFVPPWLAVTNERFLSAVLSFTFLFGALFVYLKVNNPRFLFISLSLLAFLSYPPSLFCFVFALLLTRIVSSPNLFHQRLWLKKNLFTAVPVFVYIIYLQVVKFSIPGSYDSIFSLKNAWRSFENLFSSYGDRYLLQSSFVVAVVFIFGLLLSPAKNLKFIRFFLAQLLVFGSGIVYLQEFLHTNDPERIFFPVASTLAFFVILNHFEGNVAKRNLLYFLQPVLMVVVLSLSLSQIVSWKPLMEQNVNFIKFIQTQSSSIKSPFNLIVVDYTGKLGDVNTFYADSLVSAIRFSNSNILSAEICTASGVLKNHPVADRFPIGTTQECKKEFPPDTLVAKIFSIDPTRGEFRYVSP